MTGLVYKSQSFWGGGLFILLWCLRPCAIDLPFVSNHDTWMFVSVSSLAFSFCKDLDLFTQ